MPGSESQTAPDGFWLRLSRTWGPKQIGWGKYFFLLICVAAQLTTVWISWSAWQVRPLVDGVFPNLPWIQGTPQFSTGALLVASLLFVLLSPRKLGMLVYLLLLGVAIAMDQMRCQPQVFSVAFLMAACVWPWARRLCVWYLIAMWTWAGIHKFLSPDWFGEISWYLLAEAESRLASFGIDLEFDPIKHRGVFAAIIALTEVMTGILAWSRPKLGAIACVFLHLGITCFLLLVDWNYSVLPWNLATAIVGAWLIWTGVEQHIHSHDESSGKANSFPMRLPSSGWERAIVVAMLLIPIGFYFGLVRHGLAHVLYSNNMPMGLINRSDRVELVDTWEELRLPFPNASKPYLDYFRLTGQAAETLHIQNPMSWLTRDRFFRHLGGGMIEEVSEQDFLADQADRPHVSMVDDPRKMFQLRVVGALMNRRSELDVVFAIEFDAKEFQPQHLELLSGVPNVEHILLGDCQVSDEDLKRIPVLSKLAGIRLCGTEITDQGLGYLANQPLLRLVEYEGSKISDQAHRSFIERQTDQEILD